MPLSPTAKKLIATRFARSITQGALAVDFALYLSALGWSGADIGLLFSLTGLVSTVGAIFAGPISDRFGRRSLLIGYDAYLIAAGLAAAISKDSVVIVLAAVAGGFGRGANGAAGPFGPVEQAWLAREVEVPQRSYAYSINSAAGFYGMAVGAMLASTPYFFAKYFPGADSYRPLFALVALSALSVILILLTTKDEATPKSGRAEASQTQQSSELTLQERKSLWIIAGMNLLNATAIGIAGPLVNYWFFKKFGVGPELLGPFQAVSFTITALASQANSKFASKVGLVESVVYSRALGLVMLLILPIMPTFQLAAVVYMLRSLFNRGTIGNRNAVIANMVRPEHAGRAFSYASASAQFPMALGPLLSGPMIDAGWFATPFYIAGVLQVAYVGLYKKAFTPPKQLPLEPKSAPLEVLDPEDPAD